MAHIDVWIRLIAKASGVAIALFLIGFVVFANAIEREPGAVPKRADGIVVLTGGRARISEAVKLLAAGKAERLLISGVNRATTRDELSRLAPGAAHLFQCCIDLDRRARNTTENARETRAWAKRQGFDSLIVVTSSYHMPRTLVEFERAMPGVVFTPFAVASANLRMDAWWAYPGTLRLLFSEYVKYIRAVSRFGVARLLGQSKPSNAPRTTATAG